METCPRCKSQNTILYYDKPDGKLWVYYLRCNDCLECFHTEKDLNE
jgi:Zn ribbon nucleic-acid-binding protein